MGRKHSIACRVTMTELADWLGISRPTLWRWEQDGRFNGGDRRSMFGVMLWRCLLRDEETRLSRWAWLWEVRGEKERVQRLWDRGESAAEAEWRDFLLRDPGDSLTWSRVDKGTLRLEVSGSWTGYGARVFQGRRLLEVLEIAGEARKEVEFGTAVQEQFSNSKGEA
jgi:hypothetical protein